MGFKSLPHGFYSYCKSRGITETVTLKERSIILTDAHPSQVGMLQAYELSRIADALERKNHGVDCVIRSLERMAKSTKETNAIFKKIHQKLADADRKEGETWEGLMVREFPA